MTVERALELLDAPSGDRELGTDPDTGLSIVARSGRFGPYVQLGELQEGSKEKPKTASLLKDMALDTVTFEDALRLLSLPRVVGADPADGVEITAQNGRYGPYLKKGTDSRSLEREEQMFTVTLEEAPAIFAQPKRRGRQAAAPLKELGTDPNTDRAIVCKEGRFGPYVTDGETNASLRKGDLVEQLTLERAIELLDDRRARGPAKKKRAAKKAPAKKATKKKSTAKKKAPTKKAAGAEKKASGAERPPS
jgi:DNA topoisomerase-1